MRYYCSFVSSRRVIATLARPAAVFILLLQLTHPTSADVQEAASDNRDTIWKTVLSKMPRTWKDARYVAVRWVSDREMERLTADQEEEDAQRGDDSTIQGFYDRSVGDRIPATITIRANLPRDEATFVLSHEFAHMVWDDVLTRQKREDYRDLWEGQRRRHRLVSRYAGESEEEGFAEAVATYIWQNDRLKRRDELSYEFVDDLMHTARRSGEETAASR